jgi:hypothetical protein
MFALCKALLEPKASFSQSEHSIQELESPIRLDAGFGDSEGASSSIPSKRRSRTLDRNFYVIFTYGRGFAGPSMN